MARTVTVSCSYPHLLATSALSVCRHPKHSVPTHHHKDNTTLFLLISFSTCVSVGTILTAPSLFSFSPPSSILHPFLALVTEFKRAAYRLLATMSWISDAKITRSPSRYMASDYHRLTNRRASSPPSPDLNHAYETIVVQANDRRPVKGSPDKRASPDYSYIAPCIVQGLHEKDAIRRLPGAWVKEDNTCKLFPLRAHQLTLAIPLPPESNCQL